MSPSSSSPIESLITNLKEGGLHHAILILGRSIQQAEDAALTLAQELLFINTSETQHPDLFHLRPAGKARIISVEKTRELISSLNQSSNQGGHKVLIIHEVDRMRKEAANAFLKTLEEPPPGTFLFLLSTKPYALLPTIRSRCIMARLPVEAKQSDHQEWKTWEKKYQNWINSLLNRESLKKDRITPLFEGYGLANSLLRLIKFESDKIVKKAKQSSPDLEEKEKDALEAGVRRGVRTQILQQLAESTREVVISAEHRTLIPKLGMKLSRVLHCLERNVGLMEINLKDDAALEHFYLSSLRIWTAK